MIPSRVAPCSRGPVSGAIGTKESERLAGEVNAIASVAQPESICQKDFKPVVRRFARKTECRKR